MQEKASSGAVVPCEVIIFTLLHAIETEGHKRFGDCVYVNLDKFERNFELLTELVSKTDVRIPCLRTNGKGRYIEIRTAIATLAAKGALRMATLNNGDYYFTPAFATQAKAQMSRAEPHRLSIIGDATRIAAVAYFEGLTLRDIVQRLPTPRRQTGGLRLAQTRT